MHVLRSGFVSSFVLLVVVACGSSDSGGTGTPTSGAGGTGGVGDASTGGSGGSTGDAGTTAPPSCVGGGDGLSTCGPSSNESCCESPLVTGGTFFRSYDGVTFTDQGYPATVSDFRLDKYEVTVGRFRKFKAAWDSGWRPTAGAGKHTHLNGGSGLTNSGAAGYEPGWDTAWASNDVAPTDANLSCSASYQNWTSSAGMNENRPMNCANWYEQHAFCIWDGGFLPSEAEWNYAAAGGSEQRVYPWSSPANSTTIDCSYANQSGCTGIPNDVGSESPKGDGRYGQADLTGNVWEFTLDWGYGAPYVVTCNNCYYSAPTTYMVIRGGSFFQNALAAERGGSLPAHRDMGLGARCARTP